VAIVTLADAKDQLNIPADDTSQDLELQRFVEAVTAPIERELGRVVEPRTVTDEIGVTGSVTSFLLRSVPVISLTSLVSIDGTQTWSIEPSVTHVDAESGRVTLLSGPPFTGTVMAIYQAGMTVIGANIQLAALITIQHLWETQRGRMGAIPGGGDIAMPAGYALPNRACELLDSPLPGVA
jgi:hypothetical protein